MRGDAPLGGRELRMEGLGGPAAGPSPSHDRLDPTPLRRLRGAAAPDLVVIGASTGGPQALIALLSTFSPKLSRLSVCVTLHMPADLMPVVAAHVASKCQVPTKVVTTAAPLEKGIVCFAPGDRHLAFQRSATGIDLTLCSAKPIDYCRPAVDVMFTSAARSHGSRALGVVLSGMGKDGLAGSRALVAAGGDVLVQDKASSAVWGMPGAVAKAELASAILDPAALAREIIRRLGTGRPIA